MKYKLTRLIQLLLTTMLFVEQTTGMDIKRGANENRKENSIITQYPEKTILLLALLVICLLGLGALIFRNHHQHKKTVADLKSEIDERNYCLDIANERQDWLIKEIHHRVKNNLQIIMSLLNTQSSFLKNQEAIKAIRNCQHRMFAISLVHQKLYQTDNLSSVDMVTYTNELLEYLKDEYNSDSIAFNVDMAPLNLEVALAVPFGLIINEAVSNILKFAFPEKSDGEVNVTLRSADLSHYSLCIADNGVGLGHNCKQAESDSFGKNLIIGLASQLGGSYMLKDNHGVKIEINFCVKPEPETIAC